MEGVTANAYRGWRAYWKRRGYERLNGSDTGSRNNKQRRKSAHVVELSRVDAHTGDRGGRRRLLGRWRLKLRRPKIRFVLSPKKWLTKLRDAYVNMMMSIGNSGAYYGGGFTGSVDYGGGRSFLIITAKLALRWFGV
ncbi:hypothetical protein Dimus_016247, partial [Dionaea muscipula]